MVWDLHPDTTTSSTETEGALVIRMPPPVDAKPLRMVRPAMETADDPATSKPRLVDAQSIVVADEPSTEEIVTAEDPSVEPHEDEPCVPGRTKTERVEADIVAASADAMELHGADQEPHDVELDAEFEFETSSAARASSIGTVVGPADVLASVAVAALMRYNIVDGFETPVKVCDVADAGSVVRVGEAHVAMLLASHASMA